MKNTRFKAGLCVPKRKIGNVAFNKDEIIKTRKENKDCQILLFPELSLTGYTCGDLFFQAEILESCLSALEDIKEASKENKGARIILGLPLRRGNSLYNVAAFLNNGKILGFVPKSYLPNYSEFYEQRWFKEGKGIEKDSIFIHNEEIPFGTDLLFYDDELVIGGEICEDLFVPDKPSTHLALKGANVIVNLSASDEVIGKHDYRKQLVLGQSGSCYLQYLYVSSGEDESSTDLVFSGNRLELWRVSFFLPVCSLFSLPLRRREEHPCFCFTGYPKTRKLLSQSVSFYPRRQGEGRESKDDSLDPSPWLSNQSEKDRT